MAKIPKYFYFRVHAGRTSIELEDASDVDVVEVVRCKDCKHFPVETNRDGLVFPDEVCPCHCEDFWYSWKPKDDFYCGKGERKDD